ncbi:Protein CBG04891 [Caenorhabditis briggsae]|uniref:Protein CBG04891 n=1 Tax=Caenorhabditis briggsae TaxID=6238 RepID=A8WYQ8_CAEBR|nr:Protein CBG04891 [Caenorhabditis briggsae]CAP25516.1 Protein CBG04891 [Caenorhabditis briggsae]
MILVERSEKEVSERSAICFLIVSNIIYAILPVYFLLIGLKNLSKCPINPSLPIWLICVAIFIIIDRVIFWKILINEAKFEKTFRRPETDDYELMKTWEKDRAKSSSKILILAKTNLRIFFFVAIIIGAVWSQKIIFTESCKPTLVFTVFGFSFAALICYLVSFIETMYIICVAWLSKLDLKAKRSLSRIV